MKKFIWVTFQREGFHLYPDAPEEVEFLKVLHRHMFHFKIHLEVFHDDRDVEFILFKREMEKLMSGDGQMNHKSCEMMACDIAAYLDEKYAGRDYKIDVSEDGENGALIYSDNWS